MSGEVKTVELLPCPFCGGQPELNDYREAPAGAWVMVHRAKGCVIAPRVDSFPSEEAAIAAWNRRAAPSTQPGPRTETLHIVFDGPPSPEGPRFIEVETPDGKSICAGEWSERPDGLWQLVIGEPKKSALAHEIEQEAIRFIAASQAGPRTEGEVVAWRWKDWWPESLPSEKKAWQYGPCDPDNDMICVTPLFASPLQAVRGDGPLQAQAPSVPSGEADKGPVDHMVQRFLSWRLPEDFNPDNGISFKATFNDHMDPPMRCNPTGTNLFDAQQATEMVRYMLGGSDQ